jgi:cell cycle sensor histidine kinase DivJ
LSIIRDCLDALLHPSARYDALTRARHRAFMAPRLLGSLAAFAAFPVYRARMCCRRWRWRVWS